MKYIRTIPVVAIIVAVTSGFDLARAENVLSYAAPFGGESTQQWAQVNSSKTSMLFQEALKRQEQEDYAGAIASYTEFLKTNPKHAEAYSNRGFSKAMIDDLRGALKDFDKAISLSPNNADAHNARGNVNAMAGNLAASIRDFNRSIRCDRNFADAYYNRALSKQGLGDRQGAISDLDRAAKLFQQQQDSEGYRQAQEWLDKLK